MTIDAYCMKCRATRTITSAEVHVNARGTRMAQGPCPVCGTKVTKFLPKADAAANVEATPVASTPTAQSETPSKPATKGKTARSAGAATAVAGSAKRGTKKGV